jgi:hypothetical protein
MSADHPGLDGPARHAAGEIALTFVVCLSDDSILKANLLASPCLGPGSPHEVMAIRNAPSAAAGLRMGLERARNWWVVCVHQDVFLPEGWDQRLARQLAEAERRFGPIGVAGVYGVGEIVESQTLGEDRHPASTGAVRPSVWPWAGSGDHCGEHLALT